MDALILNGSPRGSRGVTAKLLQSLAEGLAAGGASITEFMVAEMHIGPCKACLSCMHKHRGVCMQKDDMEQIYARLKVSNLLVLGTPVYTDNMTAQIKAVLDRSVCSLQPFLMKDRAGRIRHPLVGTLPPNFSLSPHQVFRRLRPSTRSSLPSRHRRRICTPSSSAPSASRGRSPSRSSHRKWRITSSCFPA